MLFELEHRNTRKCLKKGQWTFLKTEFCLSIAFGLNAVECTFMSSQLEVEL